MMDMVLHCQYALVYFSIMYNMKPAIKDTEGNINQKKTFVIFVKNCHYSQINDSVAAIVFGIVKRGLVVVLEVGRKGSHIRSKSL